MERLTLLSLQFPGTLQLSVMHGPLELSIKTMTSKKDTHHTLDLIVDANLSLFLQKRILMMNSQSIPQEAHVAASVLSWPREPGKPAHVFVPASL